jgi:hypothetical protein
MNRIVALADQATRLSVGLAGQKRRFVMEQKRVVAVPSQLGRIAARHCREATKLRPRCLIDVESDKTGNLA